MQPREDVRAEYAAAWAAWNAQLEHLHRVLLEGESLRPDQLKGLLNREARRKNDYDAARLRLLGLDPGEGAPAGPDANPFKS